LGAFANLIAIPLTTFVVMPLEAVALSLDLVGLGAPAWWLTGHALDFLLWIAHGVAASPAAVMLAPAIPSWIFGMMVLGGLWCLLWRSGCRWLGAIPVAAGIGAIMMTSPPDILVTGDGRHVAVRTAKGMAILLERAGDYVRDVLSESAGYDGVLEAMADLPQARCSIDLCAVQLQSGARTWRLLVTRTDTLVERASFAGDCAAADIVVSDRGLPRWCQPRWLKIDRYRLARTGGVAIDLDAGTVRTVRSPGDAHPWIAGSGRRSNLSRYPINYSGAATRPAFPECEPETNRRVAVHRRCWPDRAGP
ncbi:MAG: ComEC/Rec2 family competence protein, partial [bacterium]|nr:ComEC/Rec2 family competence protein [bacterium]